MSWTDPKTWVGGEVLTAAELNEQVRDNLTHLYEDNSPGSLVVYSRTAELSVPNMEHTQVTWTSRPLARGDGWKAVPDSELVVPDEGLYLLGVNAFFARVGTGASGVGGYVQMTVTANSEEVDTESLWAAGAAWGSASGGASARVSGMSSPMYFEGGETLRVFAFRQAAIETVELRSTAPSSPQFWMWRIGDS